ncbi:MAG TPA: hypothetical protein VFC47_13960 [Caulobacteraceae bacterium]|nr:hypothetical protein [Caulobacteraceae bacterium]
MSISLAGVRAPNSERLFYQAMVLSIIAAIVLGFSRSFFLRPLFPGVPSPAEAWFYVHGALFTLWLALLFTQVSLVGAGKVALHRRLGAAGYAIAPLMVAMGLIGAVIAARRPGGFIGIPAPPLAFMVVPTYEILLFALLAGAALAWRRAPQVHKRLIILASITLIEPAAARWPFEPYISSPPLAFWTQGAFLIPLVAWDIYSRKRPHPATLVGAVLLLTEAPLREMIAHTPQWMAFARWSTGLLG